MTDLTFQPAALPQMPAAGSSFSDWLGFFGGGSTPFGQSIPAITTEKPVQDAPAVAGAVVDQTAKFLGLDFGRITTVVVGIVLLIAGIFAIAKGTTVVKLASVG